MQDVSNNPMAQAIRDFHGGDGCYGNPYPKLSNDFFRYENEYNRLLNKQLASIRESMTLQNLLAEYE